MLACAPAAQISGIISLVIQRADCVLELTKIANDRLQARATKAAVVTTTTAVDVDLGSRFLPFDIGSYASPNAGPLIGRSRL